MLRRLLIDSSRGRIVSLLRSGRATADELAGKLGVTRSAVRAQLTAMERDGLVQREGRRPGTTRPAFVYALTRETEQLLSGAYIPMLTELVDVATDALPRTDVQGMLRSAGRRLAVQLMGDRRPSGDLVTRASLTCRLLNEHIGAATRVETNGTVVIRGEGCPLAAVTGKHPDVCLAVESLIETAIGGAVVKEHCDRSDRPQCRFDVREV